MSARFKDEKFMQMEEIEAKATSGMGMLILALALLLGAAAGLSLGVVVIAAWIGSRLLLGLWITLMVCCLLLGCLLLCGLKVLKPKEALVLTLFGRYYGTLRGAGFYFVNPFVTAVNPLQPESMIGSALEATTANKGAEATTRHKIGKKLSLKTMTLNNDKQKINDQLGNPIVIGIVVIWRVVNTAKAVFNVDNYVEFLSIQCDSALRNIVRLYPYDQNGDDEANEKSLRGSSQEIAERLREEIQSKVEIAGLEIMEARITHLAYAPEIASAMLQRQQASAIIDARQMIVDGAVGMVEMALHKLGENRIVDLDEERKAAMVSNLLVVLCGNRDAQPIVNSGSLY